VRVRFAHVSSTDAFNSGETGVRSSSRARRLYKNMAAGGEYLCLGSHCYGDLPQMALNAADIASKKIGHSEKI
jgi:hypothetical protein